jgi:hypothetical protein
VPECHYHNDAFVYGDPLRPQTENVFRGGDTLED